MTTSLSEIKIRKMYTTGQLALLLKVAPRTVSKWFDAGLFKHGSYKLPESNDRRITHEGLVAFLAEQNMPPVEWFFLPDKPEEKK